MGIMKLNQMDHNYSKQLLRPVTLSRVPFASPYIETMFPGGGGGGGGEGANHRYKLNLPFSVDGVGNMDIVPSQTEYVAVVENRSID